jgi:hypothetical protein
MMLCAAAIGATEGLVRCDAGHEVHEVLAGEAYDPSILLVVPSARASGRAESAYRILCLTGVLLILALQPYPFCCDVLGIVLLCPSSHHACDSNSSNDNPNSCTVARPMHERRL